MPGPLIPLLLNLSNYIFRTEYFRTLSLGRFLQPSFTSTILGVNIFLKCLMAMILTYEPSAYIELRFLCIYSFPISNWSQLQSLYSSLRNTRYLQTYLYHKHRQAVDMSHLISVSYGIPEIPNGL
jgi:hypothetical protein